MRIAAILLALVMLGGCLGTSGVATGLKAANLAAGVASSTSEGISRSDRDMLDRGALTELRDKYESIPEDRITTAQLRLLCDIYLKLSDIQAVSACLDRVEDRVADDAEAREQLIGRRALLAMQLADLPTAARLSQGLESPGGRFIHALAEARQGRPGLARTTATELKYKGGPVFLYMSAILYVAAQEFELAREVLFHPRHRLVRDYGLRPYTSTFGQTIEPGVFRLDLFGEFDLGVFSGFSYAPKANHHVEFVAAQVLARTGATVDALERQSFLIDRLSAKGFRGLLWMALYERASLHVAQGRTEEAISDLTRSIDTIEEIRSTIRGESGRVAFLTDKFDVYSDLVALLLDVGRPTQALEVVERAKGRALVDLLHARKSFGAPGRDVGALLAAMTEAEAKVANAPSDLPTAQMQALLDDMRRARRTLHRAAPDVASLVSVVPVPLATLQAGLRSDEAALVYYQSTDTLYTFCLRQAGAPSVTQQPIGNLSNQIEDLRTSISHRTSDYVSLSRSLHSRLVAPAGDCARRHHLTIVPAGSLYYLPFGALLDPNDAFLLQKHVLRVLPSLTVMASLRSNDAGIQNLVVFGNPARRDWDDLPASEREAELIAQAAAGQATQVLIGRDATEDAFYRLAPRHSLIHIASHGEFNGAEPMRSRLILAPTQDRDGDLTVDDLYGLSLDATIVTLSGCETALTDVSVGDELIGLQRGFLFAGARGLVGSLWNINDVATTLIMTLFYEQLLSGVPPDTALQQAMLLALEDPEYAHPYFWAPFQYTGLAA